MLPRETGSIPEEAEDDLDVDNLSLGPPVSAAAIARIALPASAHQRVATFPIQNSTNHLHHHRPTTSVPNLPPRPVGNLPPITSRMFAPTSPIHMIAALPIFPRTGTRDRTASQSSR